MTRTCVLLFTLLCCAACAADHESPKQPDAATSCIADGGGFLDAQLRGAVVADIAWKNADMQCAGGPRPDGEGVRLTFAGELPATAGAPARKLRFIFGVDPHDIAAGSAQALPTNLTVIFEGEQQLYATRGDAHCAVESLDRTPLATGGGNRVHARGYCLAPATSIGGDARVLVPTFEFTGIADTKRKP
jgi:hypothetical protein